MKLTDLSPKSRATLAKLAKANGLTPLEVLRYINDINLRRKVSKHFKILSASV